MKLAKAVIRSEAVLGACDARKARAEAEALGMHGLVLPSGSGCPTGGGGGSRSPSCSLFSHNPAVPHTPLMVNIVESPTIYLIGVQQ